MAGAVNDTNPASPAARFLLKPARKYEEEVKALEPYKRVQEKEDDAHAAGSKLIANGKQQRERIGLVYTSTIGWKGNALETITVPKQRPILKGQACGKT